MTQHVSIASGHQGGRSSWWKAFILASSPLRRWYGDIVPGTDVVRGLAVVEAIAGQFYIAVMIARLMSLYMRDHR
jgi:hypothetical protein